MQIPVMTFNIQHGLDYNRRNHQELKDFLEMKPELLEALKKKAPRGEDPALIDLSLTIKAIQTCGAEIIGINEVRDESDAHDPCFLPQARIIAEGLGYHYYHFGKAIDIEGKGPYGNALVSKYPFRSVQTIAIPDPEVKDEPTWYESRCIIKAEIELPAENGGEPPILTVLVTHMGLASTEAKNAVQSVLQEVTPGMPTLLMGDFNLTPDSPTLTPLRAVFEDAGSLLPPGGDLSFPSDAPDQKIDYVMTAGPVRILKAEIPALVVSDHRPHTALLEL
ncbi:MAG: hypothetical protein HFE64_08345 [Lachnospiraceae bacterium]|jgi:endonuclease/exonuclease/phosphatase family metal-dependent hydrolase|nr:hypothetical protein [Lachnospiraceae bacterium]